ncbi:MAG TPA: HlyD family efflux transporter periplasmic adaptor subunit [Candidatus Limnocylindrales bacterium]|nr:HlyD family efflux transporter periplasmic adaptor subunit [Candidatus Limnocylindrales bacterium]
MTPTPPPASPRRSRVPIAVVVVIVIGVLVALGVANGMFGGGPAGSPSPSSSVPGVIPADQGVVAEGRAVPVRTAELQAGAPGEVTSVPVAEGAQVAAGDVLLQLDDAAAKAQVTQAQAGVDAANASVSQAEASLAQARAGADAAQAAAEQASAAVRAADAARDALPAAASNAQKRQANAQVEEAQAGLRQARAARTQARAQVDVASAAVTAAKAEAARATGVLDAANAALAQTAVIAPFAGTVVAVDAAVGDEVQPGVPLVRVADLSGWRFETTDLSETSIARVRDGAPVTVTVDGLPGIEIPATVDSVGDYGASSQGDITFRVVAVPTGDVPDGLRWNMTVTLEIEGDNAG